MSGALRTLVAIVLASVAAIAPAPAQAELEITPDDFHLEVLNAAGEPENRAGAHPDLFTVVFADSFGGAEGEQIKDMVIHLPPGFGGDLGAQTLCQRSQFESVAILGTCPTQSQVGQLVAEFKGGLLFPSLFALEPAPGEAVSFGINQFFSRFKLMGHLRAADQGLSLTLRNLSQSAEMGSVGKSRFEFWGVPADHQSKGELPLPRRPLLTTPTRCGVPIAVTIQARTWQEPSRWAGATVDTGEPLRDCEALPFKPRIDLALSDPSLDSPTGVRFDVTNPQTSDPDGRSSSQVRRMSLALPEGMAIAPGGVTGLSLCTDAQLGLGTDAVASCPSASRVGTAEVASPQLTAPLTGEIYLGQALPGERYRFFVVVMDSGTQFKLVGALRPDPATGRLTAALDQLPQVSFERISLRFDGGPRALLAAPLRCGPAQAEALFSPYSGTPDVASADSVPVQGVRGAKCPDSLPFDPRFVGGSSVARGGKPTAFSMTLSRRDGEQLPGRFDVALPRGLSAATGTVVPCSGVDAAAGRCSSASRVGSSVAEVGSGPSPAVLHGDVYLTESYRRAPFGLAIAFAGKLGPFELGSIVVRSALRLDPRSGQVSVEVDSPPQMLDGIPIRFQMIGLDIDRPGFMRNPTSCVPAAVAATIRSTEGVVSRISSPFSLGRCTSLPFRPSFSLALIGQSGSRRDEEPGVEIEVRAPRGGANLRRADVLLPKGLALSSTGIRELCARGEAIAGTCPDRARVGTASGRSPLLGKRLTGAIFIAQPAGDGPPDLWTSLAGGGVRLNLRSETVIEGGRFQARLTDLPDMPLSALEMKFPAGRRGLFSLERGLCAQGRPRRLAGRVAAEGQNGARLATKVPVAVKRACARRDG